MVNDKTSRKKPTTNTNTNKDTSEDRLATLTQVNNTHSTDNGTPALDTQRLEILDDIAQTQVWLDYHYNKNTDTSEVWQDTLIQVNNTNSTDNRTPTLDRQRLEMLDEITQTQAWLDNQYYEKTEVLRTLREDIHQITMQAHLEHQDPRYPPGAYNTSPPTKITTQTEDLTSNKEKKEDSNNDGQCHDSKHNPMRYTNEGPRPNEDSDWEDLF